MTIKTIFKEGDEVWCMNKNKPEKTKIISPHFNDYIIEGEDKSLESRLTWRLEAKDNIMGGDYNICRKESELFLTKEELIKSL